MSSLVFTSMSWLFTIATVWMVGHQAKKGEVALGKYFGQQLTWSREEQPVRFVFGLLVWCGIALVWAIIAFIVSSDVEPTLWVLWPAWLGPLLAVVLLQRDRGDAAPLERVTQLGRRLLAEERVEVQTALDSFPAGLERRWLAEALRATEGSRAVGDYRTLPGEELRRLLADVVARLTRQERWRRAARLSPALLALAPRALWLIAPPPEDDIEAASLAAVLGLALAGISGLVAWRQRAAAARVARALLG
jgi:hypothetical protein